MRGVSMTRTPWLASYEQDVPPSVEYPDITLPDLLDRAADAYPDRVAVRFFVDAKLPPSAIDYRTLREQTLRLATALYQLGVRKGDRVAVMLPNCPQYVVSFFAILRLGAIVVNTNPLYVSREMREQFEDSGCETVILLSHLVPRLEEIRASIRIRRAIVVDIAETLSWPARTLVHMVQRRHREFIRVRPGADMFLFRHLLARYPPLPPASDVQPDGVALLQFTGGTTGTPKAALLTHRNLVANVFQIDLWFHATKKGEEVMMAAIPFFHVYGMTTCLLYGIRLGAEIVTLPRPRPIEGVIRLLQRCKATFFPGVPALYAAINDCPSVHRYDLGSVNWCISGAAPLPLDVQTTFERLTGGRLVEGYGLTEAAPVTHCNPPIGHRKVGSIGLPFPGVDARIVDPDTRVPVAVGERGELAVRGPQVMNGYWNRPEETAQTLVDGWLLTGDIGWMDDEGFFYIVDRKKDMINVSGLKVLPREVEEVLLMHPKVREAVAVGIPDPRRGETVKGYVVLREGERASEAEIIDFCKMHLASFKIPRQIGFRTEFPKTLVGKILRRVLAEEETGGRVTSR
jgi:long-chain acyl-CoA synthetase